MWICKGSVCAASKCRCEGITRRAGSRFVSRTFLLATSCSPGCLAPLAEPKIKATIPPANLRAHGFPACLRAQHRLLTCPASHCLPDRIFPCSRWTILRFMLGPGDPLHAEATCCQSCNLTIFLSLSLSPTALPYAAGASGHTRASGSKTQRA